MRKPASYSDSTSTKRKGTIFMVVTAMLATGFLFFIDESFYNLNWMSDIRNWIAFIIYFIMLILGQAIISYGLLRNISGRIKPWLVGLMGLPLGLLLALTLIFNVI